MAERRVVVIGGGISGLAAAWRMRELATAYRFPLELTLLEAGDRLGGALHTIRCGGFVAEAGADSFIVDKTDALDLARRLGLDNELIGTQEAYRGALVVREGRLVRIPEAFSLLAPSRFGAVLRSPLFTVGGKLRMMLEPLIRAPRQGGDESLAAFVRRRLGRQAFDRLVQPLAAGIHVADPETLSMMAAFPRFVAMERQYGSMVRGLRAARQSRGASLGGVRWNLFVSFRTGMAALVETLERRLGESVRRGARAVALARTRAGWRIALGDGSALEADGVVCAVPAHAAASLLGKFAPTLAERLGAIDYASSAVVNLAYDAADLPEPPGAFGVVMPAAERRRIIALSFPSRKFPGRAPSGKFLMRAFLGGALNPGMMSLDDQAMIAVVREEIRELLKISATPELTLVERWPDAMPQYKVGHLDRIAGIERAVSEIPHFVLAGAFLRGVGTPDCIRSANRAADALFAELATRA